MKNVRLCTNERTEVYAIEVDSRTNPDYEVAVFRKAAKLVAKKNEENGYACVSAIHGPYWSDDDYVLDVHFSV